MRTIHDLEALFADLADTAPGRDVLSFPVADGRSAGSVHDLVPARHDRRVPRWAAVTGGSLAAAAVAASVLIVGDGGAGSQHQDQAATATDFVTAVPAVGEPGGHTFAFTADAPARTKSVQQKIDETGQSLQFHTDVAPSQDPGAGSVRCPGRSECTPEYVIGSVTLYAAGEFDPADALDGTPVDVNGHRGFSKAIERLGPERVLRWEYAPGAWAEATSMTGSDARDQAIELRLAESVAPAELTVRFPVDLQGAAGDQPTRSITSSAARPDSGMYDLSPNAAGAGNDVAWGWWASERSAIAPGGDTVTAGGRDWRVVRTRYHVEAFLENGPLPIDISLPPATSDSEVRDVLANAKFATDLADRDTWFTAQNDLP